MTSIQSTSESGAEDDKKRSPFQVVVRPPSSASSLSEPASESPVESVGDDFSGEEEYEEEFSLEAIEAAYLKALETADYAESLAVDLPEDLSRPEDDPLPVAAESPPAFHEDQCSAVGSSLVADPEADLQEQVDELDVPTVSAEQVVEALLFVGGAPLPVKKILDVLGGAHTADQVEAMLDTINARYLSQNRPYQVTLVEGGYRLSLVPEFESVRNRAYGHGPKEVKLAQDVLEVLAFIAYRQPVNREGLEEMGKPTLSGVLRQLLRRELILVDRTDPEAGEQYRTTGRFLELFGLASLEDLPQAGTFNFR